MRIFSTPVAFCVVLSVLMLSGELSQAQENVILPAFEKIKVGPRIELLITQGREESVRFEFDNIDQDKMNMIVRGKTLHLYLNDAKNIEKKSKFNIDGRRYNESIYAGGKVTAYITCNQLNKLIIKGDENARIEGDITEETFKLKVYGDSDISFSRLNTDRLKVKMYGDCHLAIEEGYASRQNMALFGDHFIDIHNLSGDKLKVTAFGDSGFRVGADIMKLIVLGEADIDISSDTRLRKFVLGETSVRRR